MELDDLSVELSRASSALSRANLAATETPYAQIIGALLDAVVAVEDLVTDGALIDGKETRADAGDRPAKDD